MKATHDDYKELHFWLWACLKAGDDFFAARRQENDAQQKMAKVMVRPHLGIQTLVAMEIANSENDVAKKLRSLAQYHFIVTAGMTAKTLHRLVPLFPEIVAHYKAAKHFRKEALDLRNLVEHTENIVAAKKGKARGGWTRKKNLCSELPGSSGGIADASALMVDSQGHWLGGRMRAEGVLHEIYQIYTAALAIPPPAAYLPSDGAPPGDGRAAPAPDAT